MALVAVLGTISLVSLGYYYYTPNTTYKVMQPKLLLDIHTFDKTKLNKNTRPRHLTNIIDELKNELTKRRLFIDGSSPC